MKRLIAILCALLLLAGCSGAPASSAPAPSSSIVASSSVAASSSDGDLTVDKGLLDVTITIPADFGEPLPADFDAIAYAKENGFKKAVVGDDGSLTVTMSKSKHNEWMSEARAEIHEIFNGLVEAEETPYIKSIESNDSFNSVVIFVEKQPYMESFDMTPFSISFQVALYQMFNGDEMRCSVFTKDVKTGEVLNTFNYPEDM